MDQIPIYLVLLILVAALLITVEIGYPMGRFLRKEEGLDKYPIESSASNTVLGLLAFILAFAFGVTTDRYTQLRDIAREDADAIEDVYLMSDFLEEGDRKKVRALVRDYHQIRMEAIDSRDTKVLAGMLERCGEMHDELWGLTVDIRKKATNTVLNQFVTAVQNLMDMHTVRVNKALIMRLPPVIWVCLVGLLLLSAVLLGFSSGLHGRRSRIASTIIVVSFSIVVVLIVDLDRPYRSLFRHQGDPSSKALLIKMQEDAAVEEVAEKSGL